MKKIVTALSALSLTACATTGGSHIDPGPPCPGPTIITKEVPVPVLCQNSVTEQPTDISQINPNLPLEDQNAALRATIAQQQVTITDLNSALIGCGGTVIKSK